MSPKYGWPLSSDADDRALIDALRSAGGGAAQAAERGRQASAHVTATRTWAHCAARIATRLEGLHARSSIHSGALRIATPARACSGRVVVLGMHRSGTSCVAGALQIMGLYGGQAREFLANETENPYGFFERGDVHAACIAALAQRGGDWSIPMGWNEGESIVARAQFRSVLQPILAMLDAHGGWFMKEPRLCLLAQEFADLIDAPIFVHVWRDPRAVARSLVRRDGLTVPHALALWECYQLAALRASHGRRRVHIDYHALQRDPAPELARLCVELRAHGAAGLRAPQAAECAAWVRPEFERAQRGEDIPLPAQIDALWRAQCAADAWHEVPALSAPSECLLRQLHAEHQLVLQRQRDRG